MQAFFRPADPDLPHILEVGLEAEVMARSRGKRESGRKSGEGGSSSNRRDRPINADFLLLLPSCSLSQADAHERCPPSTKLVCTLGPACRDVDTLCQLLEAGMTVR